MSYTENTDDAGMSLWEIDTGFTGESYCRAYAWASSEAEAVDLFKTKHPLAEARTVRRLFGASDEPFVTLISDSGIMDECV